MTNKEREGINYIAVGLSSGLSMGVVLGLIVFDSIAVGISISMLAGITWGTYMNSKKK